MEEGRIQCERPEGHADIEDRVIEILRSRLEGDDGLEFRRMAHDQVAILVSAGLLCAGREACQRMLCADPSDEEARETIEEIDGIFH
jgi:hypothetical protein